MTPCKLVHKIKNTFTHKLSTVLFLVKKKKLKILTIILGLSAIKIQVTLKQRKVSYNQTTVT
jgi:hypothetical protein